jgi:FHA domain
MTGVSNTRVAVHPGSGIVARYGEIAAVLSATDESGFTDELITALQDAEAQSTPAGELAWQLAGLLQQHRQDAPAFAVSAPVAEGQLLLLHGEATAVADDISVTGRYALTWVDRVLTEAVQTITLTLGDEPAGEPASRSDLRAGVVPGAGLVITTAVAVEEPPAEELFPEEPPAYEPPAYEPPMYEPPVYEPPVAEPAVPEPVAEPAVASPVFAAEPPGQATEVIPGLAHEAEEDEEPEPAHTDHAVATLVADDGTRTALDRPYVFGRDPDRDDAVARGAATGIVVSDPDNTISRVHTYLWVNPHGVYVRDANSSNGTFIAAPGAPDWDRLGDQPAELPVGWSMRIGRRIFTHVGPYT